METWHFNCTLEKSYFVLDMSSYPFVTCCQNKYKGYWAVDFQRMLHKIVLYSKRRANPRFCLSHHSAQMLIIRLFQLCQKPSCVWRVISEKSGYHHLPVRAKWGGLMNSNTKIPRVVVLTASCFKRTVFLYRDFSKETMFIFSVENWL